MPEPMNLPIALAAEKPIRKSPGAVPPALGSCEDSFAPADSPATFASGLTANTTESFA